MEAFSDGVLAIVITIMVLKLNAPKDLTLDAVKEVFPTFLAYILSFIYVGIYWANHQIQYQVDCYGKIYIGSFGCH